MDDGLHQLVTGQYGQAVARFTEVLDHDPDFAEAYNERGKAYFLQSTQNIPEGPHIRIASCLCRDLLRSASLALPPGVCVSYDACLLVRGRQVQGVSGGQPEGPAA